MKWLCIIWALTPVSAQFIGAVECGKCHLPQMEAQAKTPHAMALKQEEKRWAFGSGQQAITYVSQRDKEHYLEHGLSWYKATGKLGLTPGHKTDKGEVYRTFAPDAAIFRCFQCHSTGRLSLSAGEGIVPAEAGVRCEACHGAGHDHEKLRNPAKMTPVEINTLCGACHRMPAGKEASTDWSNAWNTRHQPLYLAESACFLKSERLTCVTCHNPHEAAAAKPQCEGCHAAPKHKVKIGEGSCTACHMPKVVPQAGLAFTNHWIGIYAPGKPLLPVQRR